MRLEQNAPITTTEFHTLNRCLDTAIAEAVTENARLTAESRSVPEAERSGLVAHETRDLLNTALLAFEALKRGSVAINGGTAAVLARSLTGLRALVDSTLADVRMTTQSLRRERTTVALLLKELAIASGLETETRGVHLEIDLGDETLAVMADPQLLASAVRNLLSNALKFTRASGRVVPPRHSRRIRDVSDGSLSRDSQSGCTKFDVAQVARVSPASRVAVDSAQSDRRLLIRRQHQNVIRAATAL